MKIKQIELHNFRQYKNAKILFSNSNEKNITVIVGENGYGKTTLIRAFIWCLYGVNNFENKDLLNSDIVNELELDQEKEVSVQLTFEHDGKNYELKRTENYKKTLSNKVIRQGQNNFEIVIDNKQIIKDSILTKNIIGGILRPELKDYFFYDGESNSIETVTKRSNIKSAISVLMGINRIEDLASAFSNGKKSVQTALRNDLQGDDLDLLSLQKDLDDELSEKEIYEEKIKENENEIEKLKHQYQIKEQKLDSERQIFDLQKEKKELEKDIAYLTQTISSDFEAILYNINSGKSSSNPFLSKLFSYIYQNNNLASLKEQSTFNSDMSLANISEDAVNQLIQRGRCLCGAIITDGNEAYKHLMEAKDHMEPHDYGRYLESFTSAEEAALSNSRRLEQSIEDSIARYLDSIKERENKNTRLKEIKESIKNTDDLGELQKEIDDIKKQIQTKIAEINFIKEDTLPKINNKISDYYKKMSEAASNNENNELIKRCLQYASYIFEIANKKVDLRSEEVREQLQAAVNEAFEKMYHGNRFIEIEEDFTTKTITNDQHLDNSTGIETVKNFAYVSGVQKLIKQSLLEKEDMYVQMNHEMFPLVMDAPFSNTDEEHIKNISVILPNYTDQLVFVLIQRDYNLAEPAIKNKIGKMYKIVKHSETYDTIEEVEHV